MFLLREKHKDSIAESQEGRGRRGPSRQLAWPLEEGLAGALTVWPSAQPALDLELCEGGPLGVSCFLPLIWREPASPSSRDGEGAFEGALVITSALSCPGGGFTQAALHRPSLRASAQGLSSRKQEVGHSPSSRRPL